MIVLAACGHAIAGPQWGGLLEVPEELKGRWSKER